MNKILSSLFAGILVIFAGCSTPDSRIRNHEAAFAALPVDVQAKIRAGHVDIGFTPDMVQLALGPADRAYSRTTDKGTSEIWGYFDHGPKFSVGLGVSGMSGSTAVGGGVRVGDDGFRENEVMRVIFEGGRVVAVEVRRKSI